MARTRVSLTLANGGEWPVPTGKRADLVLSCDAGISGIFVVPAATPTILLQLQPSQAGAAKQYPIMLAAGDKVRCSGSTSMHIGGDLYDVV